VIGALGLRRSVGEPVGVAAHRRRRARLTRRLQPASDLTAPDVDEAATRLHDDYPIDDHRVMPTALGNIIRSAEDYGYHRYGFDSIYLWPRLAAVLPAEYLDDVDRAIIEYQTPLMVSFWSVGRLRRVILDRDG
jgi:hypothetical protein